METFQGAILAFLLLSTETQNSSVARTLTWGINYPVMILIRSEISVLNSRIPGMYHLSD